MEEAIVVEMRRDVFDGYSEGSKMPHVQYRFLRARHTDVYVGLAFTNWHYNIFKTFSFNNKERTADWMKGVNEIKDRIGEINDDGEAGAPRPLNSNRRFELSLAEVCLACGMNT